MQQSSALKQAKTLGLIKQAKHPFDKSQSIRTLQQRNDPHQLATSKAAEAEVVPMSLAAERFRAPRRHSDLTGNTRPAPPFRRRKRGSALIMPADQHRKLFHAPMRTEVTAARLPKAPSLQALGDLPEDSLIGLQVARTLPQLSSAQLVPKLKNLPKRRALLKRKTVVLDLDETLICCCKSSAGVPVKVPELIGEIAEFQVLVRPYAREVLERLSNSFEVILFTASTRAYADAVIESVDPAGEWIHHRLYRDDCILVDNLYIKDLRIINRPLEATVIVDNEITSFAYQLDNGIPIASWQGNPEDKEMLALLEYLQSLLSLQDVRQVNRATFGLSLRSLPEQLM